MEQSKFNNDPSVHVAVRLLARACIDLARQRLAKRSQVQKVTADEPQPDAVETEAPRG